MRSANDFRDIKRTVTTLYLQTPSQWRPTATATCKLHADTKIRYIRYMRHAAMFWRNKEKVLYG